MLEQKRDSDALWRIYCKKNDGTMIKTTAKKFHLIGVPVAKRGNYTLRIKTNQNNELITL